MTGIEMSDKFDDAFYRLNVMAKGDGAYDLSLNDELAMFRLVAWINFIRMNSKDAAYLADQHLEDECA